MLAVLRDKIKQSLKYQCLFSFIAGLSLAFAYAPFGYWPITIIVPAVWLTLMNKKPIKSATLIVYCFGLGWFAAGISWVHVSIAQFGGMPFIITLLLMTLLCGYLAIFPALACYLSSKFTAKNTFSVWLFPTFWLISEYLRSVVLSGFPWLSLGYSQIDSPLAAFAPVIGEIGITFIMLILAVSLSQLLLKNQIAKHLFVISTLIIINLLLTIPSWTHLQNKQIKVALIQGNIKQELRWQPDQAWPAMSKYLDLTRKNYNADLIVWPESAVPQLEPLSQDY